MISLLLLACQAPDTNDMFNNLQATVSTDAAGAEQVTSAFVDAADSAEKELAVLLPGLDNMEVAAAIISAWERGVAVAVATDVDSQDDPGIQELIDAGLPVTLGDSSVTYFDFNLGEDVAWDSSQVQMTHTVMIVDTTTVLNASTLSEGDGFRWMLSASGKDLSYDMDLEHIQIFGGSDASSLTAYSALAKSVSDNRWRYGMQSDEQLEMWLGPQERLIKRIIDSSYGARSSIYVLTDDFMDEGLATALAAKYRDGFDVRVIVGPNFGSNSRALSGKLSDAGVPLTELPEGMVVPTLVLIDTSSDRRGSWNKAQAMCLSHPIVSASRLYRSSPVLTDQLMDGSLWVIDDYDAPDNHPNAQMGALISLWESAATAAQ